MVPISTIITLAAVIVIGVAIVFSLWILLKKKYCCHLTTILLGVAVFFIVVFILEKIAHIVILGSSVGTIIKGNTYLYAVYGGLMAALFEESGRYLAMSKFMKKEPDTICSGIAYGAGHGGAEMLLILVSAMISNITISILANSGQLQSIIDKAPQAAAQLQAGVTQLETLNPCIFLVPLWERCSALLLQIAMSVLMWIAIRKGGKMSWLILITFFIHFFVDSTSVILQRHLSLVPLELAITLEAVAAAYIAYYFFKKAY